MPARPRAAALPWRYAALPLLLGILVALAYLALRDAPTVAALEGRSLNWRFQLRGRIAPPPAVAVVAIDDRTVAKLGRWPVPHGQLAAAVDRLAGAGAAVIGLDLLLLDREPSSNGEQLASGDQALFDALRRADRGVLALAFTFGAGPRAGEPAREVASEAAFRIVRRPANATEDYVLRGADMLVPFSPLDGAGALGHVNMPVEDDGTLRYMPAAVALGEDYVPAFPVALAARYRGLAANDMELLLEDGLLFGGRALQLDRRLRLPIGFYGPAGTIPTFSFIDLVEGRIPGAAFAGRAVLVGVTALGLGDNFVTPFTQTMPGVEVLATIAGNLAAGEVLQRAALRGWDVAAILLLALAAFALARLPLPMAALWAAVVLLAAWSAVAEMAFRHGLWLDMTFPAASILLGAGSVAASRAGRERRMRRNLARYHSPAIVDLLAESETPAFEGRRQDAAVMFVDIAGSTGRMERMTPDDAASFLRDFHGRIERAVLANGGVLQQFMGDGAMVVFGVPRPRPGDAAAALAAAFELLADIRRRNEELAALGQPPFEVSVGIHYGPVVTARLGGPSQAQLSTTGDTVNVASRLEHLTRAHGARIAVSDAVVEAVKAAGRADLLAGFELLPTRTVRGRVGRLSIWVSRAPAPAPR